MHDATVLIAGDRIVAVGPSSSIAIPKNARRIDGRGKWLIPGLWDMHVHLTLEGAGALPLYVANGVTSVRDMGGQFEVIQEMRRRVAARQIWGPMIVASGPALESPQSIVSDLRDATPSEKSRARLDRVVVSDSASARRAVDSLATLGVDFIKVRNYASADAYWAIARAARRNHLTMVGHAPNFSMDWVAIADSGQRSLEHWFYPTNLMGMPAEESGRIIAAYARSGTAMVPTMVTWQTRRSEYDSVRVMTEETIARGASVGATSSAVLEHWRNELQARKTPLTAEQLGGWKSALDGLGRGIGQLRKAGVVVLPGTDLPLGRLAGEGLHGELMCLVQLSGFSPAEAIAAATSVPARFLGMQDSLGTVAPRMIANLVILDADPLADISNLRRIDRVILRGRVVPALAKYTHAVPRC